MPISRSSFQRIKRHLRSLQQKKYRKQEQRFVVEGKKSVLELLASDLDVFMVVGTRKFMDEVESIPSTVEEVIEASDKELEDLSELATNDSAIAVARIKPNLPLVPGQTEFALVLDDIRDPGNLGTIIRTADWYGIKIIIASEQTADLYNSKVIQSSMGSFLRVNVYYTSLEEYLSATDRAVWGTFMQGEDVHHVDFGMSGFLVIGNEAKGISSELEPFITRKVTIPRYGVAESLNAGIACAVLLDNLKRSYRKV